jgi:hypothetical protein
LLDEHGFGHDGTRAARTGEPGNSRQQMQKQDGQIAHAMILQGREIQESSRIQQFAMHTPVEDSYRRLPLGFAVDSDFADCSTITTARRDGSWVDVALGRIVS